MRLSKLDFFIALVMTTVPALAWAEDAPAKAQGGMAGLFLPMILVFVIFYFLLIRPQQKQQKKHKEMVSQIQRDQEVVTVSGIHGKVTGVTDTVVTLEVADNVRIKIDRAQIGRVKTAGDAPAPAKK